MIGNVLPVRRAGVLFCSSVVKLPIFFEKLVGRCNSMPKKVNSVGLASKALFFYDVSIARNGKVDIVTCF